MHLELTDEQTEALIRELSQLVENDRYPLSPRIVALKEILGQLRPEPEREPRPRDGITSRRARAGTAGGEVKLSVQLRGAKHRKLQLMESCLKLLLLHH